MKSKLTRSMLIALVLVVVAVFATAAIVISNVLYDNLDTELLLKANANAANLEYIISDMVKTVDSFASDLENNTDCSLETVKSALDAKLSALPVDSITAFYVGVGTTNYLYETMGWEPAADYIVKDRPWYADAAGNRAPQVLTYEDANTGIYAICVSRGITLSTGQPAVIAIDMEITSSMEANRMSADTEYFFVEDSESKIIFHRNPDFIPREGQVTYIADAVASYAELASLPQGEILEIKDYDGADYRFTVNEITYGDFRVYTGIQTSTVTGHIARLLVYVFLTAVVLIALAACYFVLQYGKITKPIIAISRAAERIAQGDADVEISVNSRDELGVLGNAFTSMAAEMRKQADVISLIATGDYTVSLPVRSEKDLMNKALNGMLETNNKLIANIRTATDQVSDGASQIANGAQGLAEGTTEQAASVAQLSASIAAISDSINEAASSARNAAELAAGIKSKAERGSEQMDAMMNAVREINDASQNIGKVIKVIDDIAFQTNILALNAAVEAARAGQHGKGFAVVAEEVRNLASKSAEAAKNTQKLIENSIEKAELGVKIAEETNGSLQEIVEGIIASSKISDEIAVNADRQSGAIVQINAGIDQVGQVVQQNSATSEESAAASEELSAQAAMLNSLIARFRLRDSSGVCLPGAENPPELPAPPTGRFGS